MRERVVVVIPAFDEEQRIGATVAAALTIPGVAAVVVADDGSRDRTSAVAGDAGANVVRLSRNKGKAAAMVAGADAARAAGYAAAPLLFLDADLEDTAAAAAPLAEPVIADRADMTIAVLPPAPGGGHGFVVRLASTGIQRATGWTPTQPLSGQRCISRELFDAVQPLARGFGVETGLTIDALRRGARVVECPVPIAHRVTGTSLRHQVHRARQYRDVWLALAARRIRRA
ncbi:MAG TPA: glycosyltransferase [Mycobacteriales bacterium]|nr:glycosyltransferase [Mycobacteriales bacterium]